MRTRGRQRGGCETLTVSVWVRTISRWHNGLNSLFLKACIAGVAVVVVLFTVMPDCVAYAF